MSEIPLVGGLLGGQQEISLPPIQKPAPTPTRSGDNADAEVAAAKKKARRRASRAEGRASTILTDADLEDGQPNVKRKRLLGG